MSNTEIESALATIVTESWQRLRSSEELRALIDSRELALASADIDAFDD